MSDLLFRYGVRINPVVLQDVQSTLIPMNVAPKGEKAHFELMPWVFSPLLLTSNEHVITRNIAPVKAPFASVVEMVGDIKELKRNYLMATSNNTHVLQTPTDILLAEMPNLKDTEYFNMSYVPVGVVLEGRFPSAFANRMPPPEVVNPPMIEKVSVPTRQIVVACGDVIKNEIEKQGDSINALPLGYDKFTNQQFGNKEFVTNAVLYLTDQDGWMNLRNRTIELRMLNKKAATDERMKWQIINVAVPVVLLLGIGFLYQFLRRRKYAK
ncbi:MAG: hypothetical protein QM751_03540 [Paludibacteraceae bacterium]